jgi:hypothetical protein
MEMIRTLEADGQIYATISNNRIYQGDSASQFVDIGAFHQLILPESLDTTHDLAFGVIEGHTADEVLENYRHLTEEEIRNLPVGTLIYDSGFPVDQPLNTSGDMHRQSFAMVSLGFRQAFSASDPTLTEEFMVFDAAVRPTADGAQCSYGNSGSIATLENGTAIGSASSYLDISPQLPAHEDYTAFSEGRPHVVNPEYAEMNRTYLEYIHDIQIPDEYTAVCGFAIQLPNLETREIVNVRLPEATNVTPVTG